MKPTRPEVIRSVVLAMKLGNAEVQTICEHTQYTAPTVRRALNHLLNEGHARCVAEKREGYKAPVHVWSLLSEPALPPEVAETMQRFTSECWQFGPLVAAYSRPVHLSE